MTQSLSKLGESEKHRAQCTVAVAMLSAGGRLAAPQTHGLNNLCPANKGMSREIGVGVFVTMCYEIVLENYLFLKHLLPLQKLLFCHKF